MAEPKKTKKPVRASSDRFTEQDARQAKISLQEKGYSDEDILKGAGALGATAATDPYLSRNEFKPGFYTQKDQPPVTAETMFGKGTKRQFEYPTVDPDTSMMQNMAEGGSVRGQKNIQVKKKPFRGIY